MMHAKTLFTYEKIADDLRSRIEGREFASGKLPSERELAEVYKVNRITLRKSMDLLKKENLIFRDGTRGTFVGKRRNPSARKNLIVGFVLVGRSKMDQIHSVTIMELERKLRGSNSNMMLFTVSEEKEVDSVLVPAVRDGLLDAIVFTGLVSPGIAAKIADLGLPSVLLGHLMYHSPVESSFDRVCPNSVEYSRAAVQYLAKKGHSRIGLLNGPGYQWFLNVNQGYMRALDESGIAYDEALIRKCVRDTPEEGFNAMKALIEEKKPTAVFIANERLASGALEYLKTKGMSPSDKIEVITVGTEHSGLPGENKIATVRIYWENMVETAVGMLFNRLAEPSIPPRSSYAPFSIDNHKF
ncbi:MAG: GntR family transcriptional regulator [Victivallales bacterium]|nr:GntR family transcriptional regulator [Victivallales bacterium]